MVRRRDGDGDGDSGDGDGDSGDGDGDNPCDPGLSLCGGKCVDTQGHPLHCGGCDMPCADGEVCDAGVCEFIADCTMTECPGFSYCDLPSMQCLPGCGSDDQCNSAESCNLNTHECECAVSPPSCSSNNECPTGACYVVPFLGGFCSECTGDSDCANGCSPPNPFGNETIGPNCLPANAAVCNDGGVGSGCETDAACLGGLTCEPVLELLGLISINSCSECGSDADCNGGQLCAPNADLPSFSGQRECIAPGSMANNKYCELQGNGDQACQSGICSLVDVMGLAEIGACGECNSDLDCGGGTCIEGELILDTGTLVGSSCG